MKRNWDWFWEGMLFGAVFWAGVVIALLIGVLGS